MHEAAGNGHPAVLELLHAAGGELDSMSSSGCPLHWAAGEGAHTAVHKLLEIGASVDSKDAQGLTPLIMAAACQASTSQACLEPR